MILFEIEEKMEKSLEVLGREYVVVCIGCVNLNIFDCIMVSYYGVDILFK